MYKKQFIQILFFVLHSLYSCKLSLKKFFFLIQLDYRAFSIGSRDPCKSLWIKICHKREFSYTCIYMYKLVIILIKYRESPENLRVHVLNNSYYIQVVQINTSTTVYVAQGCLSNCVWLDTLTVVWVHVSIKYSYWKFKKWVEMWRKEGGLVGWVLNISLQYHFSKWCFCWSYNHKMDLGLWIDKNPSNKCTCIYCGKCMHAL